MGRTGSKGTKPCGSFQLAHSCHGTVSDPSLPLIPLLIQVFVEYRPVGEMNNNQTEFFQRVVGRVVAWRGLMGTIFLRVVLEGFPEEGCNI